MPKRPATPEQVGKRWADLLRLLPDYDPFADAGGCWFDAGRAEAALSFFGRCCRHVEGALAGEPFLLERWQQSFVANLFGWMCDDGKGRAVRRYREALLYVPRKNGKTPLAAAIALYVFFCDDEDGQQDYIAAAEREQAGLLFRQCKGMVDRCPDLAAACRVYGGNASAGQSRSLYRESDGSYLRVISADGDVAHGGNSHLVIIDELHAQPDRELVDVLSTSTASLNRKQPLTLYLTTADYERPSICNEKHDYACKVRDGLIRDARFLPVIYEAPKAADWTDPQVWAAANPNLGVSVSEEYLRRECEKAKENPALENVFRRLHLNTRTEQDVRWIPADVWARGGAPFDAESLRGKPCYAGLDFGWRDDYAALALVFPPAGTDGPFHVLCRFWLPREGRRDRRAMPTSDFVSRGLVTLTEGNSTDIESIYAALRESRDIYDLREIALDPANARKQGQDLQNDGFAVFEFVQSKRSYNEPCRFLETLLKDGRLRHGGNAVLAWMASNVSVELNGLGEIMPRKVKSAEKIDGVCAMVMGLARAMLAPAEAPAFVECW